PRRTQDRDEFTWRTPRATHLGRVAHGVEHGEVLTLVQRDVRAHFQVYVVFLGDDLHAFTRADDFAHDAFRRIIDVPEAPQKNRLVMNELRAAHRSPNPEHTRLLTLP